LVRVHFCLLPASCCACAFLTIQMLRVRFCGQSQLSFFGGQKLLFLFLGFSAATKDLPSNAGMTVQALDLPLPIQDAYDEGSRIKGSWIDTRKLLRKYNSRPRRKLKSQSSESSLNTANKFSSSTGSTGIKISRSRSRSGLVDVRPRTNSLPRRSRKNSYAKKDVKSVLRELRLDIYIEAFDKHEIDMEAFKLLKEGDLVEIGIQKTSVRRKILAAIKDYMS
jgi:hypothetical protein